MHISVQPYDSEGTVGQVVLEVEPTDPIENLRKKVEQKMGIPVADQILLYGKKLDDGRSLESYDIPDGSAIKVVRRTPLAGGGMRVIVLSLREKMFVIEVEPSDTVEKLKEKVGEKFGFPATSLRLVHTGKSLENGRTLFQYSFQNEDVVYVLVAGGAAEPTL